MQKNKLPKDISVIRAILVLPLALVRSLFLFTGKVILYALRALDESLLAVIHSVIFYGLATPILWIITSVDSFLELVCKVIAGEKLHNYLNEEAKENN